jgi:hypothetical protein
MHISIIQYNVHHSHIYITRHIITEMDDTMHMNRYKMQKLVSLSMRLSSAISKTVKRKSSVTSHETLEREKNITRRPVGHYHKYS